MTKRTDIPVHPYETNGLLFCLREGDAGEKARVLAQWDEARWDDLVRQSIRHGVSAYLHHRLRGLGPAAAVPAGIERRLADITCRNAARNIRLYRHMGRMIQILDGEGIQVILLKGVHLAAAVYGDIALRFMDDADILVRTEDLHRTVEILFRNGFQVIEDRLTGYVNWSAVDRFHIPDDARHFFTLAHPEWPMPLDVHCSLMEESRPVRIDTNGLWNRAVRVRAEGIDALALSPVDALVYACLHASLHHLYEYGLRPFCDILEMTRRHRNGMDWDEAQNRAEEWGVRRSLSLTLRLAGDLMAADVPDRIIRDLPRDGETTAWVVDRIVSSSRGTLPIPFSLARFHRNRRIRDLVSAALKTLFIPRKKLAIRYNQAPDSKWIFFLYPVHFAEMVRRWGRITWGIVMRRKNTEEDAEWDAKNDALERWLVSGG